MKAYLKDVLGFAAIAFCVIATNAIILFVVYLICGTLESGAAAILFLFSVALLSLANPVYLIFGRRKNMRKNESDLIRKKLKETILKMTPYQQDLMLAVAEKMKENRIAKLGPR